MASFHRYLTSRKRCIYVNDLEKGCIGYPGFIYTNLNSGRNKISFAPNSLIKVSVQKFEYIFDSEKVYFFELQVFNQNTRKDRVVQKNDDWTRGSVGWVELDESKAITKMQGLRLWE